MRTLQVSRENITVDTSLKISSTLLRTVCHIEVILGIILNSLVIFITVLDWKRLGKFKVERVLRVRASRLCSGSLLE